VKLFLDSAVISEIQEVFSWGVVEGLTTNPSLLKKALQKNKTEDLEIYIRTILKTAKPYPVSLEVTKTTTEEVIAEARALYKMFNHTAKNVCIKIPICLSQDESSLFSGLKAISEVSKLKIPVNATLIFTPEQALLAAKAGAKYISPFAGRVDDFLRDNAKLIYDKKDYYPAEGLNHESTLSNDKGVLSGVDLVKRCVLIIKKHNLKSEVIAASIRNARQARECAEVGAHIATLPLSVLRDLLVHEKTFEGVKKFSEDTVKEYAELIKK
jgi:transaldolase